MKKLLIIIAFGGLLAGTLSCGQHSGNTTKKAATKKGKYVCTMHPSVTSDTLGVCPKCGMQLIERDTTDDK